MTVALALGFVFLHHHLRRDFVESSKERLLVISEIIDVKKIKTDSQLIKQQLTRMLSPLHFGHLTLQVAGDEVSVSHPTQKPANYFFSSFHPPRVTLRLTENLLISGVPERAIYQSKMGIAFVMLLILLSLFALAISVVHYRVSLGGAGPLKLLARHLDQLRGDLLRLATIEESDLKGLIAVFDRFRDVQWHSTLNAKELTVIQGAIYELVTTVKSVCSDLSTSEAERALGQSAAQAAHDIRSPLAAIRSFLRYAYERDEVLTVEEKVKLAPQTKETVDRIEKIIAAMLETVRVDQLDKKPTNLSVLMQKIVSATQGSAFDANVLLSFPVVGNYEENLDAHKFERVFENILRNAIEATAEQEKRVVSVFIQQTLHRTEITVKDTGVGMSAETQKSLFQKYFSTKGAQGNGLGLAYCKKVVEAHGGKIIVRSQLGEGTEFVIQLPRVSGASLDELDSIENTGITRGQTAQIC